MECLGARLRHRLQPGRRHLPCLLPVDPGAAARGAGRHRLLRAVASRLDASRHRPRRRCPVAGLHRRRVTWVDVDLGRLPGRGAAGRHRRPMARQASAGRHRRRRPAGAAGAMGTERRLRPGQPHPAVGQPAALARHRRRPRADPVARLEGADRRSQAAGVPAGSIAATRVSCWPRPTRCWRRRSSSAPASR